MSCSESRDTAEDEERMTKDDGEFADLRVVVLDDNRNFQNILRTMLRHLGFRRIDTFADQSAAMTHVQDNPIDIAFVDHMMPRRTGVEWIHMVRRLTDIGNRDMAIVMVTAHADHRLLGSAITAGADDVLAKPLAPATLLRHLRGVLTRPRPYARGGGGYYGPDVGPALRRLREMARGNPAESSVVAPRPSVPESSRARPTLPGMDVEIRRPVAYPDDALFLD